MNNSANILYFDEAQHKYTDVLGNPFVSVTTFISEYYDKFDIKAKARQCYQAGLRGNPKYAGKSIAQIEAQWDRARIKGCDNGNVTHNYLEQTIKRATNYKLVDKTFINGRIYTVPDVITNPGYGEVTLQYFEDALLHIKYPDIYHTLVFFVGLGYRIYAEIGVFSIEHRISGLIDVFLIRGDEFIIIDWKTNKGGLRYEAGYWEKDREGFLTGKYIENYERMKFPIQDLPASTGYKYTLQLSLYAKLASLFGLKCKDLILFHIMKDERTQKETIRLEPIKFLDGHIGKLLSHRLTQVTSNNNLILS
jgi:hypothetical protein